MIVIFLHGVYFVIIYCSDPQYILTFNVDFIFCEIFSLHLRLYKNPSYIIRSISSFLTTFHLQLLTLPCSYHCTYTIIALSIHTFYSYFLKMQRFSLIDWTESYTCKLDPIKEIQKTFYFRVTDTDSIPGQTWFISKICFVRVLLLDDNNEKIRKSKQFQRKN